VCAESVQQRDPSINLDSIIEFAANENLHRAQNYGKKNNEAQHVRRKEDLFCGTINIRRDNTKLTVLREHIAFSISAFISMLLTTFAGLRRSNFPTKAKSNMRPLRLKTDSLNQLILLRYYCKESQASG